MKICSKCDIEKPNDQYYTYFHSRQNKFRTRRICNDCMKKQKNEYNAKLRQEKEILIQPPTEEKKSQPEEPVSIPAGFKLCVECNQVLSLTEYYKNSQNGTPFKRCKKCHNMITRASMTNAFEQRKKECGGSQRVLIKPNTYEDEYQKAQTFWVMELMGWTYNENGVWSKEGIKDKNNFWPNVKPKEERPKPVKVKRTKWKQMGKEMSELRNNGMIFNDIAKAFGCSKPTVIKVIREYNGKS